MKEGNKGATLEDMAKLAERRLRGILRAARKSPTLLGRVGGTEPTASRRARKDWRVDVRVIGAVAMARLNGRYRGKAYATDVLSFPAPPVFAAAGMLGELAICLPVLRRQARERGHSAEAELEILLVHGVLHLLGMDHERGPRQAAEMARWETRLLSESALPGLIRRGG